MHDTTLAYIPVEVPSVQDVFRVIETAVDQNEVMNRLKISLLAVQAHRFRSAIMTASDPDGLLDLYGDLNQEHQAHLLLSAEVSELLAQLDVKRTNHDPQRSTDRIKSLLVHERITMNALQGRVDALLGASHTIHRPGGDYSALRGGANTVTVSASPRLDSDLVIDLDSPLAIIMDPASGVFSQPRLPMSGAELAHAVNTLRAGLAIVSDTVPGYGMIVRNFTNRLMLRKSIDILADARADTTIFVSETVSTQIGAVRILNPHLPSFTAAMAAEQILHESIHNFLRACEYVCGSFCESGSDIRLVSPWSGNAIDSTSFVHAVFVYFACFVLADAVRKSHHRLNHDDYLELTSRELGFISGFMTVQPLSVSLLPSGCRSDDILSEVDALQEKVKFVVASSLRTASNG